MNILIVDADSACVDFALRCQAAGHKVKAFVRQTKEGRNRVGDGLFEKVATWEPHMKWADLIFVTDNICYIHALDRYITQGYPILGPGVELVKKIIGEKHVSPVRLPQQELFIRELWS